jgi:hypothetical protein
MADAPVTPANYHHACLYPGSGERQLLSYRDSHEILMLKDADEDCPNEDERA